MASVLLGLISLVETRCALVAFELMHSTHTQSNTHCPCFQYALPLVFLVKASILAVDILATALMTRIVAFVSLAPRGKQALTCPVWVSVLWCCHISVILEFIYTFVVACRSSCPSGQGVNGTGVHRIAISPQTPFVVSSFLVLSLLLTWCNSSCCCFSSLSKRNLAK